MVRSSLVRFAVLLLAGVVGGQRLTAQPRVMSGQSRPSPAIQNTSMLPAAQVTTAIPAVPESSVPAVPRTPGEMPARRAEVKFQDGKLVVQADNSSLNQILRDIGQQTHMKIVGGVADERVYGNYGPADPEGVLTLLLDGSESNVLLIAGSDTVASQLILTPRNGGPTPPSPSSMRDREQEEQPVDRPPVGVYRPAMRPGIDAPAFHADGMNSPGPNGGSFPPAATTTPEPSANDTNAAPAADSTNGQSPNGVKTPQQIYDQLMKMRQQSTTTTPP